VVVLRRISKWLLTTLEFIITTIVTAAVINIHIIKSIKKFIIHDYSNSTTIDEEFAMIVNSFVIIFPFLQHCAEFEKERTLSIIHYSHI